MDQVTPAGSHSWEVEGQDLTQAMGPGHLISWTLILTTAPPVRPKLCHSVLSQTHLSDEVPADLCLLVEEGQDVTQPVPDQRGLVVHG